MNADAANLGFGHFIAQSDVVGKTLLAILVLMSVASWAIFIQIIFEPLYHFHIQVVGRLIHN